MDTQEFKLVVHSDYNIASSDIENLLMFNEDLGLSWAEVTKIEQDDEEERDIEFRVLEGGNYSDGFTYRIEEIINRKNLFNPDVDPIVKRDGNITTSASRGELKRKLERMLKALERPSLAYTKPKLIELREEPDV